MQIGVADTGGDRADQHFMGAGLADFHIFNDKRFTDFAQNGSFHGSIPFCCPVVDHTGLRESSSLWRGKVNYSLVLLTAMTNSGC